MVVRNYTSFILDPTLKRSEMTEHLRRDDDNPSEDLRDEPQRQISSEDLVTSSPRQPSGKDPWNQWTTYTLTLLQLEQTTDLSGQRGTGPPTEPGFSQGFFSVLSPMEFSFLAAVASGLLSWGHFISSTIIDLIAQILFKLN